MAIRDDALRIIEKSLNAVLPDAAVKKALEKRKIHQKVHVISIGKAAWNMAKAAEEALGDQIIQGLVITKYKHSLGPIKRFRIIESGHPIPDENSIKGAELALSMIQGLSKEDLIILLISGGGSALFEKPLEGVTLDDIIDITDQLLGSGADIIEINTVRKHLSAVKGGRFAKACGDAKIYAVVLSDVIGDSLDAIASGPVFSDCSTSDQAIDIIEKYNLRVEDSILNAIKIETPKVVTNCESIVTGSVAALCSAVAENANELGYEPTILTTSLECEAKEAGKFLGAIIREIRNKQVEKYAYNVPCAVIVGGETVVHLMGKGRGGRNQEVALAAAMEIEGLKDVVFFSLGSDGTDGPTDAAGGLVDGGSVHRIRTSGIMPEVYLDMNDSYNALKASNDLIFTGATGTNVNDVMVALIK